MFRSNWDVVSPLSWLDSLADEEEFMRGFDQDFSAMRIHLPRASVPADTRRRGEPTKCEHEDEPMEPGAEETEESLITEEEAEGSKAVEVNKNFFCNLPAGAKLMDTQVPSGVKPPQMHTKEGYAYYTYAYSTCLTADDRGRRITSTRRRYEDSAGRLKALHKRQIGSCTMESTWKRASEKDAGTHQDQVTAGSVEGFEQAWKSTPFGVAEEHAKAHGAKQQTELPDQPPAQELP